MTLTKRLFTLSFLVLLAFSIFNIFIVPVQATTYFSTDFESYATDWTGTGAGGGGSQSKSSTQAHGGTYSARIYSPTVSSSYAYAYKDFTAITGNYHVSIWIWVGTEFFAQDNIPIFGMWDTSSPGYYTIWCSIFNVSGTITLKNGYGGGKPPASFQDISTLTVSTWYHIDAYIYRGVGNKVAYYVDGVDKGDFTVNNDRSTNRDVLGDTLSLTVNGAFYADDLDINDTAEPAAGQNLTFTLGSPIHIIASVTTPHENLWALNVLLYAVGSTSMWRETSFTQTAIMHILESSSIAKEMLFSNAGLLKVYASTVLGRELEFMETGIIHFVVYSEMNKETYLLIFTTMVTGLLHPLSSVSFAKELTFSLTALLKPLAAFSVGMEVISEFLEFFQTVTIYPYAQVTLPELAITTETAFAFALIAFILAMAAIGLIMLKKRSD